MDLRPQVSAASSVSIASGQISVLPYFIHRISSVLPINTAYSLEEVQDEPTYALCRDTLKELATHGLLGEVFPSIVSLTKDIYNVCVLLLFLVQL